MQDTRAEQLFGLQIAWTSCWIFNCYTIGDRNDRLVVVDPGLPIVADSMLALLQRPMGRAVDEIASIVCTHGHCDHVAGVRRFLETADVDVLLPRKCKDYLEGEHPSNFAPADALPRFLPVLAEQPFSAAALKEFVAASRSLGYDGRRPFTVDFAAADFVDDGDTIASAPGWEVIHAPGHTHDSTCLYHPDSATLISGDAVVTQDGAAWFNPEYVDLDAANATEERLRSLEVRHLLPGHGKPIESSDVWRRARSSTDRPTGDGLLARCSRRFGRW